MNAMRNASDVTLNTIPNINELSLPFAFMNVKELKMENASMLENNDELSELKRRTDELIKKREEKRGGGKKEGGGVTGAKRERHRVERGRSGEPSCSREVDHSECV